MSTDPTAEHDRLRAAVEAVLALHVRKVEKDVLVEVEGGRATVREDLDYCVECGDVTGICPTAQLLEDALSPGVTEGGAS